MKKRILYLSPNEKMFFSFAGHILVIEMADCEVVKSTNPNEYAKHVDTNDFDLIVVLGEYQFLVNEIEKHGVGQTPVIYLDIYDETKPLKGATLLECFMQFDEPIQEIEKVMGISIL